MFEGEVREVIVGVMIALSVFGVIANVINIFIFNRIKSDDSTSTNLLGMSISDFFICLTSLAAYLFNNKSLQEWLISMNYHPLETILLVVLVPNSIFSRVTILFTTMVSVERCLCVTMPLKVKYIVTRRRAQCSVALGFILTACVAIPIYYVNRLGYKFSPVFNRTIIGQIVTEDFYEVNALYTPIDVVFFYIFLFVVNIVSTALLVVKLNKARHWRQAIMINNVPNHRIINENKIIKMVVLVSVVSTFCHLPNAVVFPIVAFVPDFTVSGSNTGVLEAIGTITIFLNLINASVNIFIYLNNSSSYRTIFNQAFHLLPKQNKSKPAANAAE